MSAAFCTLSKSCSSTQPGSRLCEGSTSTTQPTMAARKRCVWRLSGLAPSRPHKPKDSPARLPESRRRDAGRSSLEGAWCSRCASSAHIAAFHSRGRASAGLERSAGGTSAKSTAGHSAAPTVRTALARARRSPSSSAGAVCAYARSTT